MEDRTRAWYDRRTSRWQDWVPGQLLAAKQRLGLTVSVVIPARNEQRTVDGVVGAISRSGVSRVPLLVDIIVMDSDSDDDPAEVAAAAGAVVYRTADVAASAGSYRGQGGGP